MFNFDLFGISVFWTLVVSFSLGLYIYTKWENYYFPSRDIKCLPSTCPIISSFSNVVLQKEHMGEYVKRVYNLSQEDSYVGTILLGRKVIAIRDLDLIKQIAIKDFDSFVDHYSKVNGEIEPLFGNNVLSLTGKKWKDMRATLSPAFTSAKMKGMFDFVAQCGKQMADHYLKEVEKPENKGKGYVEVEMKDSFSRYTHDVIATTAFGYEVDSLKDKDNLFYRMGKSASHFRGFQFLKFVGFVSFPMLMKILNMSYFTKEVSQFFRSLVADTMAEREKSHVFRPDMIQLLMEAKKGSLKHEKTVQTKEAEFAAVEESFVGNVEITREWSNDDMTAQALFFLTSGFDGPSTVMCFMAHELTQHPNIQKRLQEEVDSVAANNGGKLNYQDLQNMKYMDCVISETLRMWPPIVTTDRECVKPYTLLPPNKQSQKSYQLNPGQQIWIPIYGIHHDPKYYEDPEMFDPDRFSEERKEDIKPFSYIPFGVGPRNCIGSRFALMEAKAVIFHLLQKFDFVKTNKTQDHIRLTPGAVNLHSVYGFWIGLKPRNIK